MLKIATVPVLARILSKLDLAPIIERLKSLDIFAEAENKTDAITQLDRGTVGILAAEVIGDILPQLDRIGGDIPEFVALYKGCSIAEANELDLAEVINDIVNDDGIRGFFITALRRKIEQTA